MIKVITSESVTEGHPDKVCDYIADSILDYALSVDPDSQMAIECSIKNDVVFVFGEENTQASIPYDDIIDDALLEIGYYEPFRKMYLISKQSSEIANAVTGSDKIGAGDQGVMFGYATNETENYMPMASYYAHKLTERLTELRKTCFGSVLGPDGKAQVSIEYEDGQPKRIKTIVISTQHKSIITQDYLVRFILNNVILSVFPEDYIDENTEILINPSGSFIKGGPEADSGLTGRKIVVDAYGADCPVGGGSFSGKSYHKADRSAAYYCRYVAKNIVAANLADRIQVSVAYAIGKSDPLSVNIDTFGTNHMDEELILEVIHKNFDFSVPNIIDELNLKRPIYKTTTNYGHFGKPELPWEQIKELHL